MDPLRKADHTKFNIIKSYHTLNDGKLSFKTLAGDEIFLDKSDLGKRLNNKALFVLKTGRNITRHYTFEQHEVEKFIELAKAYKESVALLSKKTLSDKENSRNAEFVGNYFTRDGDKKNTENEDIATGCIFDLSERVKEVWDSDKITPEDKAKFKQELNELKKYFENERKAERFTQDVMFGEVVIGNALNET